VLLDKEEDICIPLSHSQSS